MHNTCFEDKYERFHVYPKGKSLLYFHVHHNSRRLKSCSLVFPSCVCVCECMCVCVRVSFGLLTCVLVCAGACRCLCVSWCLSVSLSVCLSVCVFLSVSLFLSLFLCWCVSVGKRKKNRNLMQIERFESPRCSHFQDERTEIASACCLCGCLSVCLCDCVCVFLTCVSVRVWCVSV